jgi:hypothetical protein
MEYTVEDYINFIKQGRRDKISPKALDMIAERFDELKKPQEESLKNFFTWLNTYENLEYTEKGINFYVNDYIKKNGILPQR